MALKDLFKKTNVEPEIEETVDPVVEQRRREKFSQPLIYGNEFDEPTESKENIKSTHTIGNTSSVPSMNTQTQTTKKVVKPVVNKPKIDSSYQMSEVISPMYGRKEEPKKVKTKTQPVRKKTTSKSNEDQLVPVISPFYGVDYQSNLKDNEVEEVVEEVVKKPTRRSALHQERVVHPDTVTEDLRNIASMVQEGENELKLVEKRTGEFQFDFSKMKSEEPSLIDEIDDAMTLDELMSLYEKKFKEDEE